MPNSQKPLVSVIIRTTDRPELLQAIKSVLTQTYKPIEIIVVYAVGGKGAIHTDIADISIREIISQVPLRRSAAANTGLDNATGEYMIFLDDDDLFEKNHIDNLVLCLSENPGAVAAYSGVRCSTLNHENEELLPLRIYNDPFNEARLFYENYIPINGLLFKSGVCNGASPCRFDENLDLFEDWDFWLQLLQHGNFIHHNGITAIYRIHDKGGEGVKADSNKSLEALDYILNKWRNLWTSTQLRGMVAHTRLLNKLLGEHQALLHDCNAELINLTWQNKSNQGELESLKLDLENLKKTTNFLVDNLMKKNELITTLQQELASSRQEVKEKNNLITILQQELVPSQHEVYEKNKLITTLQQELDSSQQETVELLKDLNSLKSLFCFRLYAKAHVINRKFRTVKYLFREKRYAELNEALYKNLSFYNLNKLTVKIINKLGFSALFDKPECVNYKGHIKDPLVSIIIPVYQHSAFLKKCIDSALYQTYKNLEVIIVDDKSPDTEVANILTDYDHHPFVKVFYNMTNMGISATQNRALLESRGDIIAFLDCDDYLAPDAVASCIAHWKENTVYSHSARVNIDSDNNEINRICFQQLPRADYFSENLVSMYATHFKMIRRDVFSRLGLFDPRFDCAQDYDFLMRVAAHYPSEAFVYVPLFIYFHRLHGKQNTELQNTRQQEAVALIKHEAELRKKIQLGTFEKKISFIMLSFGKKNQTLDAIRSLKKTVKIPHEIILFDNGSDAKTIDFIKNNIEGRFDNTLVIYNPRNLGTAQGRRVALQYASGDWFVIFDNDEVAETGWLEEMLIRGLSDPQVGAVTAKVIFPNKKLQCCGGTIIKLEEDLIRLDLIGSGLDAYNLESAQQADCDWCPIGATLFTINPSLFLHSGYPNVFEDAGVSMGLRKLGYRLLNSPASWVWHNHMNFEKNIDMSERYKLERYDATRMMISIASFYKENGLIIYDDYVWRENHLDRSNLPLIRKLLEDIVTKHYPHAV